MFIREHPELAGPRAAAAIDIARFEWAQVLAFDEAKKKALHVDELLGTDPSVLTLALQPYLSLIELDYAVDDYFIAVRQSDAGMRSESSNAQIEARERVKIKCVPGPKKQKLWLAVHRCENEIYFKRLDREAFITLTRLGAGDTMMVALESGLADANPSEDWAVKVRDWFQNWAALGWFCR